MTISSLSPFFLLILLLLAGLYLFLYSLLKTLPRINWIAATPTSPIRSLALGLVEVSGIAKIGKPGLFSPATGQECCLSKYKVQELRRRYTRYGTTTKWVTIDSGFLYAPFFLSDEEDNKILVNPKGAKLDLKCEIYYPGYPSNISDSDGIDPVGSVRYLEWAIYPNTLLYVLGEVKKNPKFADIRAEIFGRLAVIRGDEEKLGSYDKNKDGQVDIVEWDQAVREVEKEVTEETLKKASTASPLDTLVIEKPSLKRPFILSNRSEKEVLNRLRWKGYSLLLAGLLLIFFNLSGIFGLLIGEPAFGKSYYQMIKLIITKSLLIP